MKKEKSPVLVIFTILLLFMFIILPPMFRNMIPKQEINNSDKPKLRIINCNRIFASELYQVRVNIKYSGSLATLNTITYQKIDTLPENYVSQASDPVGITVADEYTYFKSIPNMSINESDGKAVVTINNAVIRNNPAEDRLTKYLNNNYLQQKKFYEDMGYKCNIIES